MGETTNRLEACGIKIEEDLQIIAVFASLPPEYDPSVTAIVSTLKATTRDPSLIQLKMEFIMNLLLNEETCHIQIRGEETPNKIAAQATAYPHGKQNQLCYICHSKGHLQANCPTLACPPTTTTAQVTQEIMKMVLTDLPDINEVTY
jgi:hypothetical protein